MVRLRWLLALELCWLAAAPAQPAGAVTAAEGQAYGDIDIDDANRLAATMRRERLELMYTQTARLAP